MYLKFGYKFYFQESSMITAIHACFKATRVNLA